MCAVKAIFTVNHDNIAIENESVKFMYYMLSRCSSNCLRYIKISLNHLHI